MNALDIAAILVVLAAVFGLVNHHLLRLPTTIGLVLIALVSSFCVMAVDAAVPDLGISATARAVILEIDFSNALLEGMLGFLLFAGALHVDLEDLRENRYIVALMASLGVVISTVVIGLGFHWIVGLPFLVALVFGALITPTDPVAVLGMLKEVKVPASLESKIAGESLFNDGVAYVVFLILVAIAFPAATGHAEPGSQIGALDVLRLFAVEAGGGAVLGGVAGWLVFGAMKRVDDYALEVTLTLALVMGVYALATALHMSGPIAVVVAGLFIGHTGMKHGMSETTREHVDSFWRLIDEILNAVLFLLIGFEVFAVTMEADALLAGLIAIPLMLAARALAVGVPMTALRLRRTFTPGAYPTLVWAGLRGGISVALALSLPDNEWKPLILTATYIAVVFSIVVQGLTVSTLVRRVVRSED